MSGRTEGGVVERGCHRPTLITTTLTLLPTPALAHASDRGHVLLLPTGYYIAGGALAVAVSFLVLALLPPATLHRFWRRRLPLFPFADTPRTIISVISFAGFATLNAAGLFGSRDPLSNPLPLTIWTLLWVGLAIAQGLFGDLWSWLNPWYGPRRIESRLFKLRGGEGQKSRLPSWLGRWPAVILFFAFAWFELIYPAPDDPARLAYAAGLYWLLTFIAMLAFGYRDWSRRGEFLTIFFAMVARFAVVERDEHGRLALCWPGSKLLGAAPLPASGIAFLLLSLSSVSFDGLSKTFFWLGLFGINPLEYPGRTALIGISSFGLVLTFVLLAAAFLLAVILGQRLAGSRHSHGEAAGLLVWSIVPIALAYHVAHYLTALLVDGQYAIAALSDPFALGWNLFGAADMQIEAGLVAGAHSAWWLWNLQAGIIIAGHMLAVLVAHGLAWRLHQAPSRAALSQLPLTMLMIAYTIFGLWLLATPTAG
ncbi:MULTISPECIES: hypothetical protein [unclassified Mesorhizobium]|uniref:hypothetical protein n=1 Tax=unclassified Mesorhizobium TaxID=325217 RepID=UPI0003CEB14D|nr:MULTISPECIES: hypothetical protein [unclassified Mesorhizobium]ESY50981.1 hypothetical protein X745_24420 [Mesorhizobium sp. LNJC374B00]ESY54744.1 hypothetical protein X744_24870 [Mesorhizobium sp. LNJC372A00]WJI81784.1 hypothetical protein NLY34_03185 [Mesorhizobium sp. C374B]WJI88302.1 hypothetical protein NLY42_05600 [Mesorhizobium sp. C372A]